MPDFTYDSLSGSVVRCMLGRQRRERREDKEEKAQMGKEMRQWLGVKGAESGNPEQGSQWAWKREEFLLGIFRFSQGPGLDRVPR